MKKNKKTRNWQTLSSKTVHKNPWYCVKHEKFSLPSGKKGNYYVIDTGNSSFVVPVRKDKIIFVKQYRYPLKQRTLELPNGVIGKGNTPPQTAKNELREETGYQSGSIKKIGKFSSISGITSEICFVYLAKDLEFVGQKLEDSEKEAKMKVVEIGIKEAYKMINDGKIIDGQTIASLSFARKILLNSSPRNN
ncbi:MAG: NUDIX hydrolase [Patescibacteria group bacterium]|nr:NUDIX hydrolase [Patescibacteria group bacterium]